MPRGLGRSAKHALLLRSTIVATRLLAVALLRALLGPRICAGLSRLAGLSAEASLLSRRLPVASLLALLTLLLRRGEAPALRRVLLPSELRRTGLGITRRPGGRGVIPCEWNTNICGEEREEQELRILGQARGIFCRKQRMHVIVLEAPYRTCSGRRRGISRCRSTASGRSTTTTSVGCCDLRSEPHSISAASRLRCTTLRSGTPTHGT